MTALKFRALLVLVAVFASIVTVATQYNFIYTSYGADYVIATEFDRHQDALRGTSDAPYRYRILTDFALEGAMRLVPLARTIGPRREFEVVSYWFHLVQNLIDFLLAYWFFRTLGSSRAAGFLGMLLMTASMCAFGYQSGVSLDTYTDIAVFMLAGALINQGRDWLIVPLTVFAALNRETALFLPIMFFSARLSQMGWRSLLGANVFSTRFAWVSALSLLGFLGIYAGLRHLIGPAAYSGSRYGDVLPGPQLLYLNLINPKTWLGLAEMYSLLPLTLVFFKYWPRTLRSYFVFIFPPWFLAGFIFGSADEARLFLVPLLIVLIPAMLHLVASGGLQRP